MGRKIKPCEFCEDEQWRVDNGTNGHQIHTEIYPYSNIISFTSFAPNAIGESEELDIQIEMNYCPVCGRKLI